MSNYETKFERYLDSLEKQLKNIEDKDINKNEVDTDRYNKTVQSEGENQRLKNENQRLKNEKQKLEEEVNDLKEKQQTMNFKERFVERTISLTTIYLICAGLFVMIKEDSSDTMKGIVMGSALITIIGLPKIIIEGLFKHHKKPTKSKK